MGTTCNLGDIGDFREGCELVITSAYAIHFTSVPLPRHAAPVGIGRLWNIRQIPGKLNLNMKEDQKD